VHSLRILQKFVAIHDEYKSKLVVIVFITLVPTRLLQRGVAPVDHEWVQIRVPVLHSYARIWWIGNRGFCMWPVYVVVSLVLSRRPAGRPPPNHRHNPIFDITLDTSHVRRLACQTIFIRVCLRAVLRLGSSASPRQSPVAARAVLPPPPADRFVASIAMCRAEPGEVSWSGMPYGFLQNLANILLFLIAGKVKVVLLSKCFFFIY